MAGILRVIVRFGCNARQQERLKQSRILLQSFFDCPAISYRTRRRAYFSTQVKIANKAIMSENTELFKTLPVDVVPIHYDITLKPDLVNFTFEGKENIEVNVNNVTDTILINAAELEVSNVRFTSSGTNLEAKCELDHKQEILTIKFPEQLPAGESGSLNIEFKGILNDKMKGFYRCKYSLDGVTKYAACTQFEAIDTRRCFPCWDEPVHKATFDMTLVVPTDLVALSNMPVKTRSETGDLTTYVFDRTPKMSAYLLAIALGEFDYVEDKTPEGISVKVYTPKGKKEQGLFGLEIATKALHYYNNYFGIPYPLPKLDCIAVPDFAAAAMENWGFVIFRESCLLVDEQNTSTANKQWIALVVAHELAHQWFGNLVTMKWWTDLWLNEGYALFMEYLCIGDLYPKYKTWQQYVAEDAAKALRLDSLKNSHPIEVPIHNPEEIDEIFDEISYCKASSIIRMLHSWIGEEDFRKGISAYLRKYMYANAEAADLWETLESTAQKPVSKIMPTWTKQTGFPIVNVSQRQEGDNKILSFSQKRFLADGSKDENDTLWMIPVNIITSKDPNRTAITTVIADRECEVTVPNVPEGTWIKVNPGNIGFYRTQYDPDMLSAFLPDIQSQILSPLDRYSLLDDLFNNAKAGYSSTKEVLNLIQAYKNDDNYIVWCSIANCLSTIRSLIFHLPIEEKFNEFSCNIYKNISEKLGWEPKPGETHLDTLLRILILNKMIVLNDQKTIVEAKKRFERYNSGKENLSADLRSVVYRAVINNGDENTLQTMMKLYHKTELHEEKNRILASMSVVPNEKLLKQVLDFSMSEDVRRQDTMYAFYCSNRTNWSREFCWQFVKDNWTTVSNRCQKSYLILKLVKCVTEDFVTEEKAKEIEEFFETRSNPMLDRPLRQYVEKVRLNAAWLKRDQKDIEDFLNSQ